jgi:transposase InsO family protein
VTKRIREIAETRVRYGYRRIHVLLQREGLAVNHKRVYRLYVEEGLQIRTKRPKRKVAAKVRSDRKPPSAPNEVWAIDLRLRYTGADVVATLNRVTGIYGVPQTIRVDNGPEFVSRDLDLWVYQNGGCSGLLAARQAHRQQLRGSVHPLPPLDPLGLISPNPPAAPLQQSGEEISRAVDQHERTSIHGSSTH